MIGIYPVLSGAGPALVADNSRSFAHRDESVGGNLLVLFVQAIGPVDVEIHRIESTQAWTRDPIVLSNIKATPELEVRQGILPN